jgi:iron complex outermembrane receptor protein
VIADEAATKGTLEEIVVTAQKRVETVQSVPVSVTVIPSEELARQGVQTIVDLARMSAALEFTAPAAAPGGGAFIRGIGTESVGGLTATASVSVVLDGVVLGNTNVTDIFDISRVEVLKGPQGTLFGSSVSAGVISLTTNAPDPSAMSATVNAEYASGDLGSQYDRRSLRATANLPLSADSALRLAFHTDENIGVFHNPYQGQESDQPSAGARVRYLWMPSEDFTLNLIADYNRTHETGVPVLTYRSMPAGPVSQALSDCGVTPSNSNFDTCSQYYNVFQKVDRGVSLQLDWNFGSAALTSISSYRLGDTASRGDIEAIPLTITMADYAGCHFFNCVPIYAILPGGTNQLQTQNRQQFSEEVRLASTQGQQLEWVAGLYYQHNKLADNEPGLINAFFTGGNFADTSFHAHTGSTDYAAFGNVLYHLTDTTRLIAGARFTHSTVNETKDDPSQSNNNNTYSIDGSASKVSWRAGVQQNLAAHAMVYATISTGYKSPEISDTLTANPTTASGGMYIVSPELPTAYELGFKTSVLDDRLAIDADVFYEDVKDYQGQSCSPSNQGTILCVAANVPTVKSKGVELDIFGRPLKGFTVNLSGIYNPASYPSGFLGSDGSNLGGHQLNYASKTKATLSAEQTLPVSADYSLVIGADYTYRSSQSQYTSGLAQFVAPATNTYNARLGVTSSKNWSIYLFGRNLGSEPFTRQLYPTPFANGGLWQVLDANGKRIVGLQVQAKF